MVILLGCPWKLVTIVSKLGYNLLTGRIQPTFKGVIIHLSKYHGHPSLEHFLKKCQKQK